MSLRIVCPAPGDPPVIPVPVGAAQANVVPEGIVPVGVYEKVAPLHEDVASLWEEIIAAGLMVTETVNADPAQPPIVGVTLYVAVAATESVLPKLPWS